MRRCGVLVMMMTVAACGEQAAAPGALAAGDDSGKDVASLTFPDTPIGAGATMSLHFVNRAPTATGTISVATSGDFTLDATATTCNGIALEPRATCDVGVVFHPAGEGQRTGTLIATSNPGGTITIALTGTGLAGMLQLAPASFDFGSLDVGMSAMATFNLTNTGTAPAPIASVQVTGASAYSEAASTCGSSLPAGMSCAITTTFGPTAVGSAAGALRIHSGADDYTAQLLGTGTDTLTVVRAGGGTGLVTSTPAGIDCGSACTAAYGGDVQLVAVPDVGSVFSGWSDMGCTTAACTVTASSLPHTITATFELTALQVTLTPTVANFGTVPLGSAVTRTVVLENDGPLPVTIDAATVSPPFALAASSTCGATLDAVARCNYDVTFSAQQVGPVTGALDVAIAGGHFAAELDGAGGDYVNVAVQGAGVVTSSPPGIDCGTTCSGLFSSPVTLAATPDPGFVFTDWSPAICTTTTCVVSPGESITAKFSPAPAYTVGGTVSGLTTTGLILQNNGGDDLTIAGDGSFTFATPIASGLAYQVTVHQQPAGAGCRIENGSGTIGAANVTNLLVTCAPHPWTMISARCEHTCGLHDDGTLWCWGQNNDAQLGDGTATKRNVPTQVGTATTWTNVVTNYYNTCAQQSDATTWCWGDNQFGQLGTGVVGGIRATPGLLSSATPWRTISIGGGFMCGIQTDGSLWCWGDSSNGQLGLGTAPDGTPIGASVPTQVGTDHDWSVLSAGFFHACAIKTDGSLWCWGGNLYGAVGDGTEIDRSTPLKVGTGTWKTVDGGSWYTCGIKSGGTLWCWGINEWGNLGDGTTTSRSAPVQVGTSSSWDSVSAPAHHTCGLQSDRSLWCWGGNFEGQLGDGTTMDHHAPIAVASFTSWASVAASSDDYSCALATDHSLWCWGFNGLGGLGDGSNANTSLPEEIAP